MRAGELEPGDWFRRTGDYSGRLYMLTHRASGWGTRMYKSSPKLAVLANLWGATSDLRVFGTRLFADTEVERLDWGEVRYMVDGLIAARRPSPLERQVPSEQV